MPGGAVGGIGIDSASLHQSGALLAPVYTPSSTVPRDCQSEMASKPYPHHTYFVPAFANFPSFAPVLAPSSYHGVAQAQEAGRHTLSDLSSSVLLEDLESYLSSQGYINLPGLTPLDFHTSDDVLKLLGDPLRGDHSAPPIEVSDLHTPPATPCTAVATPSTSPISAPTVPSPASLPRGDAVVGSDDFMFVMDAPVSIAQRREDPSLTYLNKGQYYTLRGRFSGVAGRGEQPVRTSLFLLFQGDQKPCERESYWRYWRENQATLNALAMSLDLSVCVGIKDVTYPAFNGVEFTWIPSVGCVVRLCVNCLSTDFTPQKGVKGIPLKLQADLWSADGTAHAPLYRGLCHIKVFRDKGAERKHKDELKNAEKRLLKYVKGNESKLPADRCISDPFYAPSTTTTFTPTIPNGPRPSELYAHMFDAQPVVKREEFVGDVSLATDLPRGRLSYASTSPSSPLTPMTDPAALAVGLWDDGGSLASLAAPISCDVPLRGLKRRRYADEALTVYVRRPNDTTYSALFLETPAMEELMLKVCSRYGLAHGGVQRVYKRTRKGLLVELDDNVVQHMANETDFILELDGANMILNPGDA